MLDKLPWPEGDVDTSLPEVIEERCVHTHLELASCRACVQACPRGAWVMDEDMLGIDPDSCDGCDLCVPACPQGAIQHRYSPAVKQTEKGAMAFALCEHAGVVGVRDGLMPCVHAIGMGDALSLQRRGVTYLITACGDCDTCERGGAERLVNTLAKVNRLLSARGAPLIHYRNPQAQKWLRILSKASRSAQSRGISRRALFRGALRAPAQELIQAEKQGFRAPGELLSDAGKDVPLPFVPVIEGSRCNGCDACIRLCPQQALELEEDGSAYRIKAALCTGCGVCLDVCTQQAVQIQPLSRCKQSHIRLHHRHCHACGVEYHTPWRDQNTQPLCQVCRQANHHAGLFQVLASEPDSDEIY